jgi:hypothetical protein
MNGGEIRENSAGNDGGGGVRVQWDGTFTMNKGTISGNSATQKGGGVLVRGEATFTMNGGTISENTAAYGGGVYVWGQDEYERYAMFEMTGGEISGNEADDTGDGVYVEDDAVFTKSGGTIDGHTDGDGHAVYVATSPVKKRDGNVEAGDNLSYDYSDPTNAEGWDP